MSSLSSPSPVAACEVVLKGFSHTVVDVSEKAGMLYAG